MQKLAKSLGTLAVVVGLFWYAVACSTAAYCFQGVKIQISGPVDGLNEESCILDWQSSGKTGSVEGFWNPGDGSLVAEQKGFPAGGIEESMDSIDVEFLCDGAVVFAGIVPIVWEWQPDCNQKAGIDEVEYLVGTVEIVLPQ